MRFFLILSMLLVCLPLQAQTIPESIDSALDSSATIRPYKWGILMEGATNSTEFYSRNPDTGMIPASNTKIFTTAAAVGLLGETYQFRTRVYRSAGTTSGNVFTGTIYLLGEHDITWHEDTFGTGNANRALNTIATATVAALSAQGITQITGAVEGRGAMFHNLTPTETAHQSTSSSAVGEYNRQAAAAFRTSLINAGLTFTSVINSTGVSGFTPGASWTLLHTHLSGANTNATTGRALNLVEAVRGLNKSSHNPMADLLLRHIGYQLSASDSYSAGAARVIPWLSGTAGVNTTGIVMNDGSGLAASNRFTARQAVDTLRYTVGASPRWAESLPISCTDGTLGSRLCGAVAGDVHAKTGTLPSTGAIALSGYLDHPADGKRYFFAIYVNSAGASSGGQAIDTTLGRNAIDAVVQVLGGRVPAFSPDLLVARQSGTGVELQWSDATTASSRFRVLPSVGGPVNIEPAYIIETGRGDNALGINRGDYSESGAVFQNSASHSTAPGLTPSAGSRFLSRASGIGTAIFAPSNLPAGRYRVDVTCHDIASANATNLQVAFVDRVGTRTARFALTEQTAGSVWRSVGSLDFQPAVGHRVEFRNSTQTTNGGDDRMNPAAVRFVPLFARQAAPTDELRSYRVSATGPRSIDSVPSDEYAVRPGTGRRVLVVDGYDRWVTQSQSAGANHPFGFRTAQSISGRTIESAANEAITNGLVTLANYRAVVWILGEESTIDETFSAAEQTLLGAYLDAGGALFVSGSEIGWDLDRLAAGPTAADRTFLKTKLRADYADTRSDGLNDDAGTGRVSAVSAGIFATIGPIVFDQGEGGGPYAAEFPDVLASSGAGAAVALIYTGGTANGLGAGVYHDGSAGGGRTIVLGFPFESIPSQPTRDAIMAQALAVLDPSPDSWILF